MPSKIFEDLEQTNLVNDMARDLSEVFLMMRQQMFEVIDRAVESGKSYEDIMTEIDNMGWYG